MKRFILIALACLGWFAGGVAWAQSKPEYSRTEDVIYGRTYGTALTMDVLQPAKPNGCAIFLIVSGGWWSSHDAIFPELCAPLVERGYTVFAVVHGSQPKFTISEIEPQIHRAIRFVRHNAAQFKVDPDRFGICGGSAGGQLTLIIATQGGPGDPAAKDPVDRESSAVQCAACFFPPTDFLNYGGPGVDAVGVGLLKTFQPAFGPRSDTPEGRQKLGREISPIYFVHSNMPPILIIHGDADAIVPISQSRQFVERCEAVHSTAKLVVREGENHAWPGWYKDLKVCADWYDKYLPRKGTEE